MAWLCKTGTIASLVYGAVIFCLLCLDGKLELNSDVFVISKATDKKEADLYYIGGEVISANVLNMVSLFCLARMLFVVQSGNQSDDFMCRFVWTIGVLQTVSQILNIIIFSYNCSFGSPKCFTLATSLYPMILIHLFILFLVVGVLLVMSIGMGIYYFCKDTPTSDYEMTSTHADEKTQLTYETIINVRTLEGTDKCVICLDDYKPIDAMKLLKCGHYFHEKCIKEWEKKQKKCPTCKAVIVSED